LNTTKKYTDLIIGRKGRKEKKDKGTRKNKMKEINPTRNVSLVSYRWERCFISDSRK
jgi:hypothetical protein